MGDRRLCVCQTVPNPLDCRAAGEWRVTEGQDRGTVPVDRERQSERGSTCACRESCVHAGVSALLECLQRFLSQCLPLCGHLHMAARAMEDLDGDTVFTTEKYQYKQPKTKEKSTSKDSEKAEVPHQLQALRQILLLVRTHQCFSHLFLVVYVCSGCSSSGIE